MPSFTLCLLLVLCCCLSSTYSQLLGWGPDPKPQCPSAQGRSQACPVTEGVRGNPRCAHNSDKCVCAFSPLDGDNVCVKELACEDLDEKMFCDIEEKVNARGVAFLDVPRDVTKSKCPKDRVCVRTCCTETLFVCMEKC